MVRPVVDQIDAVLALAPEASPYYSPAKRDSAAEFAARTRQAVMEDIHPALRHYRDYLANDYLRVAREALSVTANPNGAQCYEASLRHFTTLERSGMVVDPGLHLFGWTREEAKEYMLKSGRFPQGKGDEMVDRIVILPGQLTAYDSGGLEILALRREAGAAIGEHFYLREFHDRVLENGTIPLRQLRAHIESWIAESTQQD